MSNATYVSDGRGINMSRQCESERAMQVGDYGCEQTMANVGKAGKSGGQQKWAQV